jgi:hypothetical protein
MVVGQLDIHMKRTNLEHYFIPYMYIKQLKVLNLKTKAIRLLDGNISVNIHDHVLDNSFLNMPPKITRNKGKLKIKN